MKAWTDLITDKYVTLYETENSFYYIDKGVRIERFNKTGDILVQNTMTNSDKFEKVTPEQYEVFDKQGWYPGILQVNIDTIKDRIVKIDYRIKMAVNNNQPVEIMQKTREKLVLKYFEYQKRLSKFVII